MNYSAIQGTLSLSQGHSHRTNNLEQNIIENIQHN